MVYDYCKENSIFLSNLLALAAAIGTPRFWYFTNEVVFAKDINEKLNV